MFMNKGRVNTNIISSKPGKKVVFIIRGTH